MLFPQFLIAFFAVILSVASAHPAAFERRQIASSVDTSDALKIVPLKNSTAIPATSIPSQCQGQCSESVLSVMVNCTSQTCACTVDNNRFINDCTSCMTTAGSLTQDVADAINKDYAKSCAAMNFDVLTGGTSGALPLVGNLGNGFSLVLTVLGVVLLLV